MMTVASYYAMKCIEVGNRLEQEGIKDEATIKKVARTELMEAWGVSRSNFYAWASKKDYLVIDGEVYKKISGGLDG